jgi:hypothetical protein
MEPAEPPHGCALLEEVRCAVARPRWRSSARSCGRNGGRGHCHRSRRQAPARVVRHARRARCAAHNSPASAGCCRDERRRGRRCRRRAPRCGRAGRRTAQEADHRRRLLLGAKGARRRHPTAKQQHKLAAPHSMTSSARARIDCGITSPSAFAVLRLITSSNLVGCSTGRSAGLAPLRIFPARMPTWRWMAGRLGP